MRVVPQHAPGHLQQQLAQLRRKLWSGEDILEAHSQPYAVLLPWSQGAHIIEKGQTGIRMYAVIEGEVAVSIDGRIVEMLGPGGVFGEAALVDATATRIADAAAETDCSLQAISRKAFLALVKLSPEFAQTMLSSLAGRLRFLTSRLK